MTAMVTSQFAKTSIDLSKNIMIAAGTANRYRKSEYPKVIKKKSTNMLVNKMMRYEGPGPLVEHQENTGVTPATFIEGYISTIELTQYGYEMVVSWKNRRFAQGNAQFVNQMGEYLGRSASLRYEYVGINPLNYGFSTYTGPDSQYFFSASHRWKTSATTWSNLLTAADLGKTSLQTGLKTFHSQVLENSIPADLQLNQITFGVDNVFMVPELFKSSLDPESGNNTYNAIKEYGCDKFLSHYLSDGDSWYLDAQDSSRTMLESDPITFNRYMADRERNMCVQVFVSIGSGFHDPINTLGNAGA